MAETHLVKELRDQAARETKSADDPFAARKERLEWKGADEIERLESENFRLRDGHKA